MTEETPAALDVEIRGRSEKYYAELAKIPGMTEAAARKATAAWERGVRIDLAKQAAGIKAAGDDVVKSWTEVGRKLGELAGGPVAQLSGAVFDLVPKAGAASSALGGVAIAGGLVAGGAIAAAALAGSLVKLTAAADQAEARLVKAGRAADIPSEARASVVAYREAMTQLRTAVDLAIVTLGADAVGALARLAGTAADATTGLRGALDVARDWHRWVVDAIPSTDDWAGKLLHAATALGTLGASVPLSAMLEYSRATKGATEATRGLDSAAADYAIGQIEVDEAIKASNARAAERILAERKRLREQAAREARAQAEAESAAARTMALAWLDAIDTDAAATRDALIADNDAKQAAEEEDARRLAAMEAQRVEYYAAWREEIRATREAEKAARAEEVAGAFNNLQAVSAITQNSTQAALTAIDTRTKAGQDAAVRAAKAAKAAAMFGVVVNTAEAVVKAFAMFGPPPSPAGIFAAAAATSAGVAQAVTVAKEPLPSFWSGGVVPGSRGAPVRLEGHGGEGILNTGGMARLGELMVGALNKGLAPLTGRAAGPSPVYLDGRRIARGQQGGVWSRRPVGYVSPYGG